MYADIETIKERFKARMHGNLPAPVAQMLERKHGIFDGEVYDYRFDGVNGDAAALCIELACKKVVRAWGGKTYDAFYSPYFSLTFSHPWYNNPCSSLGSTQLNIREAQIMLGSCHGLRRA